MKSSRSKNKTLVVLLILIIIAIFGFLFYWEGTFPVDKNKKESEIFVVKKGEGLIEITNGLEKSDLIRNRLVFYVVVKQLGIEKKIEAGDYRLSKSMGAFEIAKALTHGTLDVWVTVIEGLRKEEIAELVGKAIDIPEIEFIKKAPEGYLFPDTYLIPRKATADSVISIMNNNFNTKFDSSLKEKTQKLGLTTDQAVTLASLVEREARFAKDRQPVASVLLHRLREGIPLQSDVTIQYILGYQENEKTWWKPEVFEDDLKTASPYNTYLHPGLPPGPICNPGLAALTAVAEANPNTPYLFYLADKSGHLHFARNLDEHQANINKYLK